MPTWTVVYSLVEFASDAVNNRENEVRGLLLTDPELCIVIAVSNKVKNPSISNRQMPTISVRESFIREFTPNAQIFREEAIRHRAQGRHRNGKPLKNLPPWLNASYYLMLLVLFATIVLSIKIEVNEDVSAPAIIRPNASEKVLSPSAGLLKSLHTAAGISVRRGDILATILINNSRRSGAELIQVKASSDEIVEAVKAYEGEFLSQGSIVLQVAPVETSQDILVFVPARYRSQIWQEASVEIVCSDHENATFLFPIERVSLPLTDGESRESANLEDSVAIPLQGETVIVYGHLPASGSRCVSNLSPTTVVVSHVKLASEPLVFEVFPLLKKVFHSAGK